MFRGYFPSTWPAREVEKPVRKAAQAFVDSPREAGGLSLAHPPVGGSGVESCPTALHAALC